MALIYGFWGNSVTQRTPFSPETFLLLKEEEKSFLFYLLYTVRDTNEAKRSSTFGGEITKYLF